MGSAELIDTKIGRYQRWRFPFVLGWCSYMDAWLMRALLVGQVKRGFSGSLAEIGVWQGKSFFLLALARIGKEKSLAIDMFNLERNNWYVRHFHENCRKFNVSLAEDEVIEQASNLINSTDIIDRAGRLRFISIDGSHYYNDIIHDLNLAKAACLPEAVLVLDDILNVQFMEVAMAGFDWLKTNPQFSIFALSKDKAYICLNEYVESYKEMFLQYLPVRYVKRIRKNEILGKETLYFQPPGIEKILMHIFSSFCGVTRKNKAKAAALG